MDSILKSNTHESPTIFPSPELQLIAKWLCSERERSPSPCHLTTTSVRDSEYSEQKSVDLRFFVAKYLVQTP
jgi:hypothetical protein